MDADMPDAPVDTRPALPMTAVPAPWKGEDIGTVGMPGGSGRTRNDFQVKASGGDIWAENDQFHFVHRPVSGDVEIVARLAAMERPNQDAKGGLMFRESLTPDARNVFMAAFPAMVSATGAVTPGKGSRLQFRDKRVDNLTSFIDLLSVGGSPDAPPVWLRLTRKGALFEGFVSGDGATWLKDGEIMIAGLPAALEVGLAVTSHTNSDTGLARFEGLRVTALTDAAWGHAELGTVGGFAAGRPTRFDLANAGRGITNDEDGITFVHRTAQHLGDVELTARVTDLQYAGTRPAKIGLMLRGMLRGDARMLSFVLELGPSGQVYRIQRRAQDGGNISTDNEPMMPTGTDGGVDSAPDVADAATDAGPPPAVLTPVSIKLVRVGHRFVGFVSTNGTTWRPVIDLPSFVIATNAYLGVVLTSGTEGGTANGRIENVTIGPVETPLPVRPDAGTDAMTDAPAGN